MEVLLPDFYEKKYILWDLLDFFPFKSILCTKRKTETSESKFYYLMRGLLSQHQDNDLDFQMPPSSARTEDQILANTFLPIFPNTGEGVV